MSFNTIRLPLISPTAGKDGDGLLIGKINSSDLSGMHLVDKLVPIRKVFREDVTANSALLTDVTTEATDATAADFPPFGTAGQMSQGDAFYFYVDDGTECDTLYMQISTAGVGSWTIGIQEWNTSTESWLDTPISSDTSNHMRAGVGVYAIKFQHTHKGSMKLRHTDATKFVWHRVYLKAFTSATTAPVLSRLWAEATAAQYTDLTSYVRSGTWDGHPAEEYLPTLDAYTLWVHPGPPIGIDVNVSQVAAGTYTAVREYMASDGTWKAIPSVADPSNGFRNSGDHRIRWNCPSDWTRQSHSVASGVVDGWLERRRITSIATAGPVTFYHLQAKSRCLGSANAQGIEYETGATYKSATFSIGDNRASGETVLQFLNADTGARATLTISQNIDDSVDVSGGKVLLSNNFGLAPGESMLLMCLSGGPVVDAELRLNV